MSNPAIEVDVLLTPAEVAGILYVDPKTVTRWAMAGKISCIRTPGGHRRFLRSEILALATVVRSQKRAPSTSGDRAEPVAHPLVPFIAGLPPGRPAPASVRGGNLAAAATVARAVDLAREVQALDTAQAVLSTRYRVEMAARAAADAALKARADRAAAATSAAAAVAHTASRAAAAVQRQADASATAVREAAVQAALVVREAGSLWNEHEVSLTALHLAAAAQAAAVSTARDTATAAASVATAVATAAADVARTVADLDAAIESEVAEAAAVVQTAAAATAREVAAEMDAQATSVALVAQEAVVAASFYVEVDAAGPDSPDRDDASTQGSTEDPDGRS